MLHLEPPEPCIALSPPVGTELYHLLTSEVTATHQDSPRRWPWCHRHRLDNTDEFLLASWTDQSQPGRRSGLLGLKHSCWTRLGEPLLVCTGLAEEEEGSADSKRTREKWAGEIKTSFVQLIVQEGKSSGDPEGHPTTGGPVHCVGRQVARQAALRHTDTQSVELRIFPGISTTHKVETPGRPVPAIQ